MRRFKVSVSLENEFVSAVKLRAFIAARVAVLCVATVIVFCGSALSDDSKTYRLRPELSNCSFYRSKRTDVPVFSGPDTTTEVIDHIALGEEVCYIGEERGFAILDWDKQKIIRGAPIPKPVDRAYVRLVELWEPKGRPKDESFFQRLKNYYYYRQSGGVPDDPWWLIRPEIEAVKGEKH